VAIVRPAFFFSPANFISGINGQANSADISSVAKKEFYSGWHDRQRIVKRTIACLREFEVSPCLVLGRVTC
jgi:hypothetical protein